MFDGPNIANPTAHTAAQSTAAGRSEPVMDQEPAWKKSFRDTLAEVREKGFRSYAEELNERKLEELRAKILASMGLSEEKLQNMSPEQREKIEEIVAVEIQERLSAESILDDDNASGESAENKAQHFTNAFNGLGELNVFLDIFDATQSDVDTGDWR